MPRVPRERAAPDPRGAREREPGFDEVDPAGDVHATADLVVLADAVRQQPVDGQDARLDAAARQRRVQPRLGPVQRVLDLRHLADHRLVAGQHPPLKLAQLEVAQYHHHRAEVVLMLHVRRTLAITLAPGCIGFCHTGCISLCMAYRFSCVYLCVF